MGGIEFSDMMEGLSLLDADELCAELRSLELEKRRIEARLAATVATIETKGAWAGSHRSTKELIRAHLNYRPASAGALKRRAATIDRYPELGEQWLNGSVGVDQVDAFTKLHHDRRLKSHLGAFSELLIEYAVDMDYTDFARCVDRFKLGADPDGNHQDRDWAVAHRDARVSVVGAEIAMRVAGGDPLTAQELRSIFERFVDAEFDADVATRRAEHGDQAVEYKLPRTDGQRRFDAITTIFRAAAKNLGPASSVATYVTNVVIDQARFEQMLATAGIIATGIDGQPISEHLGVEQTLGGHCETDDGQPLHPYDVMRAVMAGHVRRVVVDAQSTTIDLGYKKRLFQGSARIAAQLLGVSCSHAGCDIPARFTQVDHKTPASRHGRTDQDNADLLCGFHNRLKEHACYGFRIERDHRGHPITYDQQGQPIRPTGAPPPIISPPIIPQPSIAA